MQDLLSEIVKEDDDDESILLCLLVEVKMKTVNMISKWVPRLSINYSIMISYIHKQLKKYILYVNKKIKTTKRRGEETKNS